MSLPTAFFAGKPTTQTSWGNDIWAKIGGKNAVPEGEQTGNALVWDGTTERWILTGTDSQGTLTLGSGTNVAAAGAGTVAIGKNAGGATSAPTSVFIGEEAGVNAIGNNGIVSVGAFSGSQLGDNAIAIGVGANNDTSGDNEENTIAIGVNSAQNGQKANAIAIGANAAQGNIQDEFSIVINASGSTNTSAGVGTCVITPIRNVAQVGVAMYYDQATGEVFCTSANTSTGNTTVFVRVNDSTGIFQVFVTTTNYADAAQVYTGNGSPGDQVDLKYSNGRWVLVLSQSGKVFASSNDAATQWFQISTTGLNLQCIEWVPFVLNDTAVGGFWVTAGSNPASSRAYWSNNGVTWTAGTPLFTGISPPGFGAITAANILSVKWWGGLTVFGGWCVIAGATLPVVFYSFDGGRSTIFQTSVPGGAAQTGKAVQVIDSDGTTLAIGLSIVSPSTVIDPAVTPAANNSAYYSTGVIISANPTVWTAVAGMPKQIDFAQVGNAKRVYDVTDFRSNGVCWCMTTRNYTATAAPGSSPLYSIYSFAAGYPATATGLYLVLNVGGLSANSTWYFTRASWNGLYWNYSPGQILSQTFNVSSLLAYPTSQGDLIVDGNPIIGIGSGSIVASSWGGTIGGT